MDPIRPIEPEYEELYSASVVQAAVQRLAAELTPWVREVSADSGSQVLALCVLRGGFLFFSDLLKAIPLSIQPAFVRCRSYAATSVLQPETELEVNLEDFEGEGRHVLVIDDICDSGRTLAILRSRLLAHGAASVRTVALIHRRRLDSQFTPDHKAFYYDGPEWFAGYGMDDCHRYMNYPAVYVRNAKKLGTPR